MKKNMRRREMLKTMLAAVVGLGTRRMTFSADGAVAKISGKADSMPMRSLGRTGYRTPLFSLGGESTVQRRDRREAAEEIINRALDAGVNYIDTSYIYGRGGSEENIGHVMATRRSEVFLATKTRRRDYEGALSECETSLRRLQTDRIDLYQHHALRTEEELDRIMASDGALRAFLRLRDEGAIRFLGVTSHSPRTLSVALDRYPYDCALITLNAAGMSMTDRGHMDEFLIKAAERGTGVIAMKVINKGALLHRGISMEQAFAYTLSFRVATAVIGITDARQIDENTAIARRFAPLSGAERRHLERMVAA